MVEKERLLYALNYPSIWIWILLDSRKILNKILSSLLNRESLFQLGFKNLTLHFNEES